MKVESLADIEALRESFDIECKLAGGKDSKGKLPKDFWKTYSAFANTDGGRVYLGLKEKSDQSFEVESIKKPQVILDELWNLLNSPAKVSVNLLKNDDVRIMDVEGQTIIEINIPRASRTQKPVFLNENPHQSFERGQTGDFKITTDKVHRLMAEKVEESRDGEILKHFTIDDLAEETVTSYRMIFTSLKPDHPWAKLDTVGFLSRIGAIRRDRESGHEGITRAGLLMFGNHTSIQEVFPHYFLDYQERPEAKTENRWIDRVIPDGMWSGNVFDFYQKVIRKLTADLKIPFELKGDKRQENTPVHNALREALINSLVHADYTETISILVVKRPDMFGFRNPGRMRVPIESAFVGGVSDCRNKLIHQMFRYVNLGEQAGSGIPTILQGWDELHWRRPLLRESKEPVDQTLLELHTLSLIPDKVMVELEKFYGPLFNELSKEEQLVLVTAYIEESVNHARMMEILDLHPHDLTILFSKLVGESLLNAVGSGRGTSYAFPASFLKDLTALVENRSNNPSSSEHLKRDFVDLGSRSEHSEGNSEHSGASSEHSTDRSEHSEQFDEELKIQILEINQKRSPKEKVRRVIYEICKIKPHTLDQLASLLKRTNNSIRNHYLKEMISNGEIEYLYPTLKNHPDQAYQSQEKLK